MQVRDDKAWAEQLSEFEVDETSKKFGVFLMEWTQNLQARYDEVELAELGGWHKYGFMEAVSKALEVTEQTFGFLSVEWIAQMLLVISQHWVHGEQMLDEMTFIEKRLVEQATAMKLVELQTAASMSAED